MYGQTRILFAMGRDGLLPSMFAKVNPQEHDAGEQHHHRRHRGGMLAGVRPAGQARRHGVDRHADRVHRRVDRRDHPASRANPICHADSRCRCYPVTPILSVWPAATSCYSLHWYTWIAFSAWVFVVWAFYLLWGRHHSALNDGGDGIIASAAPGVDDVRNRDAEGRAVTVVVGYLAGKAGLSALNLGVEAARTLKTSLSVVTVVPKPWTTPSPAKVDAEYAQYADKLAADSAAQAKKCIASLDADLEVSFHKYAAPVGGRRLVGCRRGAESRSAGAGFGRGRQPRTGGGRIDCRPAAALVAGAAWRSARADTAGPRPAG